MPIDYKRYPPNWKTEIVPRILKRAKNHCEGCNVKNYAVVWSVKHRGRVKWYRSLKRAEKADRTMEMRRGKIPENPKKVRVVLTIAHLDHDETNHDVSDDRLKALCQLCHLRYDAKEKYRRIQSKRDENNRKD